MVYNNNNKYVCILKGNRSYSRVGSIGGNLQQSSPKQPYHTVVSINTHANHDHPHQPLVSKTPTTQLKTTPHYTHTIVHHIILQPY